MTSTQLLPAPTNVMHMLKAADSETKFSPGGTVAEPMDIATPRRRRHDAAHPSAHDHHAQQHATVLVD